MADTMQFDLVSPERSLASLTATRAQIPGVDGDFTAMPNHAPFLTTLRPGVVRVHADAGVQEFLVTGGFAEVSPDATSVLAERAVPLNEATAETLAQAEAEAEAALANASDEARIAAAQRMRDVRTLRSQLGR